MNDLKCVHHWEIAVPEGPISEGVCKKCHATKEFKNSVAELGKYQISLQKPGASDLGPRFVLHD